MSTVAVAVAAGAAAAAAVGIAETRAESGTLDCVGTERSAVGVVVVDVAAADYDSNTAVELPV